jgi:hypothetical protein
MAHHRKQGVEGMVWPGHRHEEVGSQIVLGEIDGVTKHGLFRHDKYYFQCPPLDEFGTDFTYNWIDYDTIRKGQFTRDGGPQLAVVTFRTLVVDNNSSYTVWRGGDNHNSRTDKREPGGPAPDVIGVANDLDHIFHAGTPFNLRVWNKALYGRPDVDMAVTFRTLSTRENHGEPEARYFDMSFTEYRSPQLKQRGYGKNKKKLPAVVQINGDGSCDEIKRDGKPIDRDHRTKIGDAKHPATLRKLSKHFYGNNKDWIHISHKNGIRNFGPDDSLAKLRLKGKRYHKLTIPKLPQHGGHNGHGGNGNNGAGH